ncbi:MULTISPECIES: hypothetical protein [Legionella]|uniref:Stress-induced bacterial acidophilic repeat motif protein n=1 Tax=Legionella maceachernii TaxID=466 RepID=A0A0W0WCU5_9GAMM|nr:hypothetical protein [Legionella maceachernii]KTD30170.1 hypothetical protein Lmac_0667 [Legionella maceachernii]SJZ92992.1 hypothetical protein SAMN02745128_01484 [Legionella maceachernii]SUP03474.1 Uncharacterised protein [Legionella maceachernii]
MNNYNMTGGRDSNLSDEDRKKGGEHSHSSKGNKAHTGAGRGANLTDEDRRKVGKNSHDNK